MCKSIFVCDVKITNHPTIMQTGKVGCKNKQNRTNHLLTSNRQDTCDKLAVVLHGSFYKSANCELSDRQKERVKEVVMKKGTRRVFEKGTLVCLHMVFIEISGMAMCSSV